MSLRFYKCVAVVCALLLSSFSYAEELCPKSSQIRAMFANSVPLPASGKMPYPVNEVDPYFVSRTGEWVVVSDIYISTNGSPTKFVVFVMFNGPSLTQAQALAQAKTMVAAIANRASDAVDYEQFNVGAHESNPSKNIYMDLCIYSGNLSVPPGTPDTDFNDLVAPLVMADLSPDTNFAPGVLSQALINRFVKPHKGEKHDV